MIHSSWLWFTLCYFGVSFAASLLWALGNWYSKK